MEPRHFDPVSARSVEDQERFEGPVSRTDLYVHGTDVETDVTGVYFSIGARTRPHTHSVDQILYAVDGRGEVSIDGELYQMQPGDWIVVPANVHHWHGATSGESFTQMALKAGGRTSWLPPDAEWTEARE